MASLAVILSRDNTIHAWIQKVLPVVVQPFDVFFLFFFFFVFFLVHEGREDPGTTISGPSSARKRNAIKWFRWRADDGQTLLAW